MFLLGVLKVKYRMSYRNPNGFDCNQAMSSFESVGGLESSLLFESDILQKLRHYSVSEIINFWCLQIHFFASYSGEVKNFRIFVSEKGYVVNFLPIYPIKSL